MRQGRRRARAPSAARGDDEGRRVSASSSGGHESEIPAVLAFDLLDLELPGQLPWSRADLGRLVAGDERTWDRALVLIARTVETLRIVYMLATLEIDAVRDHVEDTLMADECRRLREVRDPAKFGAYVRAVAGNRAIYIVKRRVSVLPLSDASAEDGAQARARRLWPCQFGIKKVVPPLYRVRRR